MRLENCISYWEDIKTLTDVDVSMMKVQTPRYYPFLIYETIFFDFS